MIQNKTLNKHGRNSKNKQNLKEAQRGRNSLSSHSLLVASWKAAVTKLQGAKDPAPMSTTPETAALRNGED